MDDNEIRQTYQSRSFQQQALDAPDMLIGTRNRSAMPIWIAATAEPTTTDTPAEDNASTISGSGKRRAKDHPEPYPYRFVEETYAYSPAQYKCFDEVWVNAVDQLIRLVYLYRQDERALEESLPETFEELRSMEEARAVVERMADHLQRRRTLCTRLDVEVTPEYFRVANNGDGIHVVRHPDEGVWIPEFVLTRERTSTNYKNDNMPRGGKNGVGMPSVIANSQWVTVCTRDRFSGLHYTQTFRNHLQDIEPPVIRPMRADETPGTEVTVSLDFALFECTGNDEIFTRLCLRRVIETLFYLRTVPFAQDFVAGKDVQLEVTFNGATVPVPSVQVAWPQLYPMECRSVSPTAMLTPSWHVQFGLLRQKPGAGSHNHMSMVNGVRTEQGGTHVDTTIGELYRWLAPLVNGEVERVFRAAKVKLEAEVEGGNKKLMGVSGTLKKFPTLTPRTLRDRLFWCVSCDIRNPTYDGQCKDRLGQKIQRETVPHWHLASNSLFGGKWPEGMLKWLQKWVVPQLVSDLVQPDYLRLFRTPATIRGLEDDVSAELATKLRAKTAPGMKRVEHVFLDSLQDAVFAGTEKWADCTLMFTEGKSARGAIFGAGATADHRGDNRYVGSIAARGKIRTCTNVKYMVLMKSGTGVLYEFAKSMGLEQYQPGVHTLQQVKNTIRYGSVTTMCDQDVDGIHIRSSVMNFIYHYWRMIWLGLPAFVKIQSTPIAEVKDTRANQSYLFYTLAALNQFYAEHGRGDHLKTTYLKGLGSSSKEMFARYFRECPPTVVVLEDSPELQRLMHDAFCQDDDARTIRRLHVCGDMQTVELQWDGSELGPRAQSVANHTDILDLSQRREVTLYELISVDLRCYWSITLLRHMPNHDGLKISERKLLWGIIRYRIMKSGGPGAQMKVAQMAVKAIEDMAYHHGEQNVADMLVRFAAPHYGEGNNLRLFGNQGNFGTFSEDFVAAAARYLFANTSRVFGYVFRAEDEPILELTTDEDMDVEPMVLAPIVPLSLLIRQRGISVGLRHDNVVFAVPEVVEYVRRLLDWMEQDETRWTCPVRALPEDMPRFTATPYLDGFEGRLVLDGHTVIQHGSYVRSVADPCCIELRSVSPTTKYSDYKKLLEFWTTMPADGSAKKVPPPVLDGKIKWREWVQQSVVRMEPLLVDGKLRTKIWFASAEHVEALMHWRGRVCAQSSEEMDGVEKALELTDHYRVYWNYLNMHGQLQSFETVESLVWQYCQVRLWFYRRRKTCLLARLLQEAVEQEERARFVQLLNSHVMEEWMACRNVSDRKAFLARHGFATAANQQVMIDHVNEDHVATLQRKAMQARQIYEGLVQRSLIDWWRMELSEFETAWAATLEDEQKAVARNAQRREDVPPETKRGGKRKAAVEKGSAKRGRA